MKQLCESQFNMSKHLLMDFGLTSANILQALQEAHRSSDKYYTMRHALEWNTDFVIPREAIAADLALFLKRATMIFQ